VRDRVPRRDPFRCAPACTDESVCVAIMLFAPDGLIGVELCELDDPEAAETRFAARRVARGG
jgi:hypothetical protein